MGYGARLSALSCGWLRQAVLTLAVARPAWGAGGSFACACTANVPEAGTYVIKKNKVCERMQ